MKNSMVYALITMALCGCGRLTVHRDEPADPVVTTPIPTPDPVIDPTIALIASMLDSENQYRAVIGQQPLTQGLICTLYTVPNTTTAIIGATLATIGSFKYIGTFNQPSLNGTGINILPSVLQSIYTQNYIVKCTGQIIVTDDNWHNFTLSSDDGSNLYIDGGVALINNDGQHGIQTKSSAKFLKYGFHTFELDYYEFNGPQALILNEDGLVMSSNGFAH